MFLWTHIAPQALDWYRSEVYVEQTKEMYPERECYNRVQWNWTALWGNWNVKCKM